MFDSTISAADIIADIQNEADIAIEIPNKTYVQWLNSTEQLLYSEIIREQRSRIATFFLSTDEVCDIKLELEFTDFFDDKKSDEDEMRFADIIAVYNQGSTAKQLIKTTLIGAAFNEFDDCYYDASGKLGLSIRDAGKVIVIYHTRPALKAVGADDEVIGGNVMVPHEFISLVTAKLRGEAYKLANDDTLAAKWLNDYNAELQDFAAWINSRQAQFGE